MNILALDLTSEYGSLVISGDAGILAEAHLHSPEGFGHLVFPAVSDLLAKAGMTLRDIDCFAAASGPGAFTGVRVGLSAVKGLAEANGGPAAGISNLQALATFGEGEHRAVILDARRGEVFAAVYSAALELLSPEVVMKLDRWLDDLPFSDGCIVAPEALKPALRTERFVAAPRYLASAIAQVAADQSLWVDPASLDANYVRRSDAELLWRE